MTRFCFPLMLVVVFTLACAASSTVPSGDAVRAEAQTFLKTYVDAQNKVDATSIMEMVSKRPDVASITMGEITRGWEAIRNGVDAGVGTEGEMKLALGTIDVAELGRCPGRPPGGGGGGRAMGAGAHPGRNGRGSRTA